MTKLFRIPIYLLLATTILASCATSSGIKKYGESSTHFNTPPELISNSYPLESMYRVYKKGGSSFKSIQSIRESLESQIRKFASGKGKGFVILGQRTSNPPFIAGNYPRVEIVFALVDKPENSK